MFRLNFRTLFWSAAIVLIGAMLVISLIPKPVPVDIAQVREGPMTVAVRDEGYTRVRDVYVVSALVAGRLLRVEAEPGDEVEAGAPIANILPSAPGFLDARTQREAEAALHSAEAALAFARAEVERTAAQTAFARTEEARIASLHESGIASQGAYDRVRMELRTALANEQTARAGVRMRLAEVEAAEARLVGPHADHAPDETSLDIVSLPTPISGRVLRVLQESESVVSAGTPLIEIGDPGELEVVVELLSTDAVQVEPGARVDIVRWGGEGDRLTGRVRLVEPYGFLKISALGVEEQRVNVIIDLLDPPEDRPGLGHGFRVEADIAIWDAENVKQVPVSSIFRSGEDWAVFVAVAGQAETRPIVIGRSNGEVVEVVSGLEAGERVVLYPGERISDGTRLDER